MSPSVARADSVSPVSFSDMGHVRLATVRFRGVALEPGRGASKGQDTGQIRICLSRPEVQCCVEQDARRISVAIHHGPKAFDEA